MSQLSTVTTTTFWSEGPCGSPAWFKIGCGGRDKLMNRKINYGAHVSGEASDKTMRIRNAQCLSKVFVCTGESGEKFVAPWLGFF